MLGDEEYVPLRIEDYFQIIRCVRGRASGKSGKTSTEVLRFTKWSDAIRGDALAEESRHDSSPADCARDGARRGQCQRERAVVRHGAAAEAGLMSGRVKDVSREREVALSEENNLAAAGKIALEEPALAFVCGTGDRQSDQERADL